MRLSGGGPGARPRQPGSALATAVAAALVLALASACGSSAGGQDAPRSSPAPVGAAAASAASAPCLIRPGSVCLTERARGHTVQLTVGWRLTLRLGAPGRRFSAPSQSGGEVLQALGPPRRSGNEVTAVFRAARPGTVQLRATERPVCRAGTPCPLYLALWTLTVRVNRRP